MEEVFLERATRAFGSTAAKQEAAGVVLTAIMLQPIHYGE